VERDQRRSAEEDGADEQPQRLLAAEFGAVAGEAHTGLSAPLARFSILERDED
jgi:hypothetical protein